MTEDRCQDDELNRLWNALPGNPGHVDPEGADPMLAETLRRLYVLALAPPPAAARARLDDGMRLLVTVPANGHGAVDLGQVRVLVHTPGAPRHPWPPVVAEGSPGSWPVAARFRSAAMRLATVCLVLLTLALALLMAAPGQSTLRDVAGIRSVFAPQPPSAGVTIDETLVAVELPAEALPHGERVSGNLSHFTVEPGVASSWEPALDGCCPGVRVDYVVEGELAVRPAGPAHLVRSGADLSPQTVAAGTEVVLRPGDTIVSRYQDPFESANRGAELVRLLDWVFVDGYVTSNHGNPSRWDYHFDGHYIFNLAMPDGAASLRMDTVTLQPGAVLPVAAGDLAQFGLTLADNEPLGARTDGTLENSGAAPITVHVLTVTPVASEGETTSQSAPDAAFDTVFAATLPAEMVPAAGNLDFLLWNVTLDPGAEGPASSQSWTQTRTCCPGPMIAHVLEGELTVRVDGPMRIFRGSAGALGGGDVSAGTEVTLSPGDTAIFAYDIPATFANRGSDAARIVGGGIFAGAVRSGPAASSAYHDYNEEYSIPRLPAGAVDATLVRAMLPPDAEVPAPPPGGLVLEVGAGGDADIAQRADGGLRNIGPNVETIYVLTLVPTGDTKIAQAP